MKFFRNILVLPSIITVISITLGSFPIAIWIARICSNWILFFREIWSTLLGLLSISFNHHLHGRQLDLITLYFILLVPVIIKILPNFLHYKIQYLKGIIGFEDVTASNRNYSIHGVISSSILIYLITVDYTTFWGCIRPVIGVVLFLLFIFITLGAHTTRHFEKEA